MYLTMLLVCVCACDPDLSFHSLARSAVARRIASPFIRIQAYVR